MKKDLPSTTFKNIYVKHKSGAGFTLVELLLYMGIFSILLVVLLQIFTSILSVHAESQATSSVNQDGSYIMARLSSDVRQASTVVIPTLGASSNSLHITGNAIDETYSVNGGNLLLTNNSTGTTDQLNSVNTTISINFTALGNSGPNSKVTVQIVLTTTSKIVRVGSNLQTQTFETTVGTR